MNNNITRKDFLKLSAIMGAASAGNLFADSKKKAKVVIIGGGFGGATCAKYIRRMDPSIEVTLIEQNSKYITCPMSNAVIGGIKGMGYISHSYSGLKKHGIDIVHGHAIDINAAKKIVKLEGGQTIGYDKLVVSPGIELLHDKVAGYSKAAETEIPHAWKAGDQTTILANQLKSMPKGGTFIIAPPDNPFRCPPGPYERASLVANYMQKKNPTGKILILDAKESFAKKPLFTKGWEENYLGMIEFVPGSKGGKVSRIDVKNREIITSSGKHKGDVINLIPPQRAGKIAHIAGLAKGDWCPVKQDTFESTLHKDVYVIGDAAVAGAMPKSGFSANSQGKVCAAAIVADVNGIRMPDPSYANTCYSLVAPKYGISVAAVYQYAGGAIAPVPGSGGVSPGEASADFRKKEADYAHGWYKNIVSDSLG